MPTFIDRITTDIGDAMRRRDQATLAPLRMLKAALMNREVQKSGVLDEAESLQVVRSLVKQRRDAIEQFRAGGRHDLADREQAEIAVLDRYLPPAADEAAITDAIERVMTEMGSPGLKDMGQVMKRVMAMLTGSNADGRTVSDLVKKRLSR
ncbi:MAG TPA: GatB/YqeY domain-containing protein [Vicinamibacterales bacterium]|nr:GatB/YqeY domain-containing protein [Vicinamibacterales bacterium]